MILIKRDTCQDRYTGQLYECNGSVWDDWARWLFLGLVIFGFIVLFFLFSCISARRRRRHGVVPLRGTGWAGGHYQPPPQNNPNTYYAYNQPAPPYEPNPAYASNNYGNEQSTGIELERPQGAYSGQYAPPPGAPPAKK